MEDDLIGTQQAAEILGVSLARVHQLIKGGRLPATKFGERLRGVWMIRRADLEKVKHRPGPGRPSKPKP
jgi:excisionase family DNA binding protein